MSDLIAIVRATRASAMALAAMQRHARDAADASATLAHNWRLVADGRISADAAAIGNRIASARKDAAMLAWQRASRRFERAHDTLARNPL
jgi:hypothetical protein